MKLLGIMFAGEYPESENIWSYVQKEVVFCRSELIHVKWSNVLFFSSIMMAAFSFPGTEMFIKEHYLFFWMAFFMVLECFTVSSMDKHFFQMY